MFHAIYYFFSRYVNTTERRAGTFFGKLRERQSTESVQRSLQGLIQRDVATINLWTEYRYKGYRYLTKRMRKKLYVNLGAIRADFEAFAATQQVDIADIIADIKQLGVDTAKARTLPDQLTHLYLIMTYLNPDQGRYAYHASSSFGRLLRDPTQEVLEGDCNQIVTLYLALFAQKFDVGSLQLTLLPGHVALHFCGVDIEATTGTFAHYTDKDCRHAPIHEIVSVNLLDTTDTHFAKTLVHPETFLEAARLAYLVSSDRSLVEKNLDITYRNTVRALIEKHRYKPALTYAVQSRQYELIEAASYRGALYAANEDHFHEARTFAGRSSRKQELLKMIDGREAARFYEMKRYHEALKLYERIGAADAVSHCYRGLYIQEQAKLGAIKTSGDLKGKAGTVRTMERYARASGDKQLIEHARSLASHL